MSDKRFTECDDVSVLDHSKGELLLLWQVVGLLKQRKSARNILHDMVAQAIEVLG